MHHPASRRPIQCSNSLQNSLFKISLFIRRLLFFWLRGFSPWAARFPCSFISYLARFGLYALSISSTVLLNGHGSSIRTPSHARSLTLIWDPALSRPQRPLLTLNYCVIPSPHTHCMLSHTSHWHFSVSSFLLPRHPAGFVQNALKNARSVIG